MEWVLCKSNHRELERRWKALSLPPGSFLCHDCLLEESTSFCPVVQDQWCEFLCAAFINARSHMQRDGEWPWVWRINHVCAGGAVWRDLSGLHEMSCHNVTVFLLCTLQTEKKEERENKQVWWGKVLLLWTGTGSGEAGKSRFSLYLFLSDFCLLKNSTMPCSQSAAPGLSALATSSVYTSKTWGGASFYSFLFQTHLTVLVHRYSFSLAAHH